MPELPEVETVCRGLQHSIERDTIIHANVRRADLRIPFTPTLAADTQNQMVQTIRRRSKYALLDLANKKTLVIHLGMSGRVLITEPDQPITLAKHDHFVLEFASGRHMIYTDARRFGMIFSHDTETLNEHKLFKSIGPEPLSNHFHSDYLLRALKKRTSNIKAALLDQKLVAGIGNIYASEALYEAGIHPQRISNTITQDECALLYRSIYDVLSRAIAAGGSSLKDYKHADGNMGYFQHNFAVYGREDEKCRKNCVCGGKGRVQKIVQSGRSTYFCATKQV